MEFETFLNLLLYGLMGLVAVGVGIALWRLAQIGVGIAAIFLIFVGAIMIALPYVYAAAGLLILYRHPVLSGLLIAAVAATSIYLLKRRDVSLAAAGDSLLHFLGTVFMVGNYDRYRARLAAVLALVNVLLWGGMVMSIGALFGQSFSVAMLATGATMSLLGALYFHYLKEGNMISVLDLVDDRSKLEDFFAAGSENPVVSIDPERVIAAIKQEVIGQDFVVEDVVRTLYRRTQLRRSGKPLGVFMFVGATGSGKTELAKSLARHCFEDRLVRFDMNEFTEASSAQRLVGAPPGYIGSEQGGQLTQAIKRMGNGVILFDEIEKADPAVYKMIMGLMDEGRITEQSTGETMHATNFMIIMTSNAAHRELADISARISDPDERRRAVKDTLLQVFRPEQLARVDDIFCFNKLDRRAIAQIVAKFVQKFAAEAGVVLEKIDTDLVIDIVLKHERMSDYGIRELVRLVEKSIIDGMLDVRNAGHKRVKIGVSGDRVVVIPA